MATTNFVRMWRDGDRLFVHLNGATIEARSLTVDRHLVTLEFHGIVACGDDHIENANRAARSATRTLCPAVPTQDPLLDECLW